MTSKFIFPVLLIFAVIVPAQAVEQDRDTHPQQKGEQTHENIAQCGMTCYETCCPGSVADSSGGRTVYEAWHQDADALLCAYWPL